jgi:ubiquinone/menaquinone biosynthesis C-methylase UbiE
MTNDFKKSDLPVEERMLQLLQHLGIERAHFAGQMQGDWIGLAASYPESITSLTLICPLGVDTSALGATATKLLVVNGDQGSNADSVRQEMTSLPDATVVNLKDTFNFPWADVIADRTDEVSTAVMDFLSRMDHEKIEDTPPLREGNGEFAGITYRISGSGPPIVLLPLGLAPSQWEPIMAKLGESYCTITLGGAALGFVAILEARGCSTGYLRIVRDLMEEVELRPGESVLEVGCGTGVVSRWLARRTAGKNEIVGLDINPYLLGEAMALTKNEGLGRLIEFREGNAEALPLSDGSFDVTVSCTVFEEGDAEQMLSEMIRVTKPGGRVAVIVRSVDMPCLVNVPIGAELKSKIEAPGGGVAEKGCADASLSRRFHRAGLTKVKMFPQMAAYDASKGPYWHLLQNRLLGNLTPEELNEWQAALAQAEAEKTFFFEMPHYCAVGTKPSQVLI